MVWLESVSRHKDRLLFFPTYVVQLEIKTLNHSDRIVVYGWLCLWQFKLVMKEDKIFFIAEVSGGLHAPGDPSHHRLAGAQ